MLPTRPPAPTRALGNHGQHISLCHVRLEVLVEHQDGRVADVVMRGHTPQLCMNMGKANGLKTGRIDERRM